MVIGVGVRLAWVAPGAGAPSTVFTVVDEGTGAGVCIAPATGAAPGIPQRLVLRLHLACAQRPGCSLHLVGVQRSLRPKNLA